MCGFPNRRIGQGFAKDESSWITDGSPRDSFRERGRELKHSGDKIAREAKSTQQTAVAIAKQTEAILLYVFAFWCDDQAAKTCITQNWHSVFGLIAFVKRAAEKAHLSIIVGLW